MRLLLTPEEQQMYGGLEMDTRDHEACKENARRAVALMSSLTSRRAIPKARARYFVDGDFNPGGTKSRRDVFVGNGCRTEEQVYGHPHFLKYLRYFVEGPRLPCAVIRGFQGIAGDSLREWDALGAYARAKTRELTAMSADDIGEEFFKLAVECDVELSEAKRIRIHARTVARRRGRQ